MVVLLGLTGPLGSGKGEIVEILSRLAAERGIKTQKYSISDEIRRELELRGVPQARDAMKEVANALRYRVGNSAWAMLVSSRIEDLLFGYEESMLIVIDSIRNPAEVHELRFRFGSRFKLIGVTASLDTIYRNLKRRSRHDESKHLLEDQEALEVVMRSEMGSDEPSFGHDVAACLEMADWPPIVNNGTIEELKDIVRNFAQKDIFPLFQNVSSVARHTI